MSMATLERVILRSARLVLNNPKLKMSEIPEWSSGTIREVASDECTIWLPDPGVWICVLKSNDRSDKAPKLPPLRRKKK